MKKYLIVLLALVLICCCSSALASTLKANWEEGKLTVWVDWTESPAAVMLYGDGIGASTQLTTKASSITVSFPADNQNHTVSCSPFPGLTGFNGSATFYAGVKHTHNYVAVVTEPTCTTGGYTTYTCECGDSFVDNKTEALGHDPVMIPGKAATCTEKGLTEGEKCTRCGETLKKQEEIAALGHDPVLVPGKAATCTEKGLTAGQKCARCGEILKAQVEIPALGHKTEKIAGKAATCTEKGLTEGEKCTRCGEILKKQEEIPALGHKIEKIAGKAATCTEKGLTEGEKCTRCGEIIKKQEIIPKQSHNFVEQKRQHVTMKGYKCSMCGEAQYKYTIEPARNIFGTILLDANSKAVDYDAQYDTKLRNTLVIKAVVDANDPNWVSEIGMYLNTKVIKAIKAEEFKKVAFVNEDAVLVFALDDLTSDLFATTGKITEYVITLDPHGDGGCLVRLEAKIGKDEKVAAETFKPMKLNDTIEVIEPGIYDV